MNRKLITRLDFHKSSSFTVKFEMILASKSFLFRVWSSVLKEPIFIDNFDFQNLTIGNMYVIFKLHA